MLCTGKLAAFHHDLRPIFTRFFPVYSLLFCLLLLDPLCDIFRLELFRCSDVLFSKRVCDTIDFMRVLCLCVNGSVFSQGHNGDRVIFRRSV